MALLAVLRVAPPAGRTPAAAAQQQNENVVVVDASAPSHRFPHFWEEMFGSGRAILSLRESYQRDLREVKQITDFEYVRFHAIFHDEVGIYDENAEGQPVYNFSYADQIYDGLLANGARPFVELSFMPKKLAAREVFQAFWYRPIVSPPKDWVRWDNMIAGFAKHLVERYGMDEVSQWYFEVWNEPNLDFWAGEPRHASSWELYDHTARALKGVSPRLRVGGPATAQAAWADAFIEHCHDNGVRSTLSRRTSTATTGRRMFSESMKAFPGIGWFAARSIRSTDKSKPRLCPSCPSSGASSMPAT